MAGLYGHADALLTASLPTSPDHYSSRLALAKPARGGQSPPSTGGEACKDCQNGGNGKRSNQAELSAWRRRVPVLQIRAGPKARVR